MSARRWEPLFYKVAEPWGEGRAGGVVLLGGLSCLPLWRGSGASGAPDDALPEPTGGGGASAPFGLLGLRALPLLLLEVVVVVVERGGGGSGWLGVLGMSGAESETVGVPEKVRVNGCPSLAAAAISRSTAASAR